MMIDSARFVLAFACLIFCFYCNTVYAADTAPVVSRIKQSGKLVVGTSGNTPLMSERLTSGQLEGFDIDLAQAMAETMGVRLNIKTMPFNQLIPALEKGEVGIVLSNMTMTIDRNMRVAFVGPYFISGKCLLTREQEIARATERDDLKATDAKIAAVTDTTSENFVKELLPNSKYVPVKSTAAGIELVTRGEASALLTDFPICLSVMKRNPDSGFQSVVSLLTYEPIGIALSPRDPLLINLAENFIERADQVGLLHNLSVKWFGQATLTAVNQDP